MTMQYGDPFPQGKSNSYFEDVTFTWINFNIRNTLHEFAAKLAQCWKKLAVSFK